VTTKQPDLNPVDYNICYLGSTSGDVLPLQKSVQELKAAIVAAWQQLLEAFLQPSLTKVSAQSISEWWRRLQSVVQCNGEYIEHVC